MAGLAARSERALPAARLLVGLVQGLALLALREAVDHHAWPALDAPLLAGLTLAFALAPLPPLAGLGQLRAPTLAAWSLLAAAIGGGFAVWAAKAPMMEAGRLVEYIAAFALRDGAWIKVGDSLTPYCPAAIAVLRQGRAAPAALAGPR